ncbi:protein kinase domain-containing protein [Kitasatospora purpeofusca]|uniref:protein kinase domain-containing protein n=1 Tax=Kitasatospora purpeofusca TaxID=67352 RepID=UPI002A5AEBCA|nr:protein kinase [Kitasatospora purpeofusca]MDY0816429.1 protein kinase [Kitasatospora purpeofusca]
MKPLSATDPREVGPYRLLARLGGGGMGRVFLGRSPGGLTVAVKLVRPELAEDARFRRRFAHEIEAARRVGGFYTAQVVDADAEADPPWMVTSYIPGPSLGEVAARHGPLPVATVAVLGAGLAEGLAAIHACSLVHRDLKPGNVVLAEDGPRVIDFGIARALDATSGLTGTAVIGTPGFMSPEQVLRNPATPASDVFSLGAVLAHAATGRPPFGEGPTEAVVYHVVHGEPDLADLPPVLAPLVRSCLAKDPKQRPGVAEVLERCAASAAPAAVWLPPDVTEMIVEQVRRTSELTTAVISRPPTLVEPPGPDGEPPVPPSVLPPLAARVGGLKAGYATVTLPWIPGETGGMKRTTVVRWFKQVGDAVEKGEPLLEVASGRGDVVVTAPHDGMLYAVHRRVGETARTGAVIAGIGSPTATLPRPRAVRYALTALRGTSYTLGVLLVLALIAGPIAVFSPLFEDEVTAARPGDCVGKEILERDGELDVDRPKWLTAPCGLLAVRGPVRDEKGDQYFTVLARLDAPVTTTCEQSVPDWATGTGKLSQNFGAVVLCLRER